ncbi:MAG: DUF2971 domain-containing protein [Lachnospiraceae bacterium]|nr:DUF2971 domain-containing protein [Lachnospiraceae bacterium]
MIEHIKVDVLETGRKLYHYTKAPALQSILEVNRLWATKHDFLNDRTEFEYAYKIFVTKILSQIEDNELRIRLEEELDSEIQAELSGVSEDGVLSGYYVASFSKNSDNLALWSEFAGGTGYSIGFDYDVLKKSFAINYCWEGEVVYDERVQLKRLSDTWDILLNDRCGCSLNEFLRIKNDDLNDELVRGIVADMAVMCIAYGMFCKKSEFAMEEEYRFVFFATHAESDTKEYAPLKFRNKRDILIPYIEVNSGIYEALDSITVGPKNNIDIAKNGLELYCLSKGLNVKIDKSKILLRY